MAVVLVAGTLAPALSVMRDAIDLSYRTDQHQLLANFACALLEEQIALAGSNWSNASTSGSLATNGFPALRFTAVRSDQAVDGGIFGRLLAITVTVFDDENGDSLLGATERKAVFKTKLAKLATYDAL